MQSTASLAQRVTNNLVVQSVRESFIALIPYLILISVLTLLSAIASNYVGLPADSSILQFLQRTSRGVYSLFPLTILISLSFHLGKNYRQQPIATVTLSLACFIIANNQLIDSGHILKGGFFAFQPYAMLLPFLMVFCLHTLQKYCNFNFVGSRAIGSHLRLHLNLIFPYLLAFTIVTIVVLVLAPVIQTVLNPLFDTLTNSHVFTQGLVRTIVSQILWFFGIHGTNTYNLIIDSAFLAQPLVENLRTGDLFNIFIASGGAGNSVSLVIALLLFSRDSHSRQIAKVSLPFACFNINEILLFGLPVILNPYLLVPFILVPVITYLIAYSVIVTGAIDFIAFNPSWITPPLLNSWQVSGGSFIAAGFHALLIAVGVFIYRPFIQLSHHYNNEREVAEGLANKLSVLGDYQYQAPAEEVSVTPTQTEQSNLIENLLTGDMKLYYHPIFNTNNREVDAFEVFLQLENGDGEISAPKFLQKLHRGAISEVVQLWIVAQLAEDLYEWQCKGFSPKLYLYVDKASLESSTLTSKLTQTLKDYQSQVILEIKEESFINQSDELAANLNNIQEQGFSIALDDYGQETSRLQILFNPMISSVNLDNTLLQSDENNAAHPHLHQTINLCQQLGFEVRAKLINDKNIEHFAVTAGVNKLQGWLYTPPLQSSKVMYFPDNWKQLTQPKT